MRKESQKFSKDEIKLNGYSIRTIKPSKSSYEIVQIPVYYVSDEEDYYFEVEDY